MSFNFGTPGPLGGGAAFSTPASNNNNLPQGGGAAKLVRFDTSISASGAASPFGGFGTPASTGSSGGQTLAGLLGAPQTSATGLGLGGSSLGLGGQPSLLGQLGATTKTTTALTFNLGQTGLGGGLASTVPQSSIAPATGFNFGGGGLAAAAPAASSAPGLFGFSATTAATTSGVGTTVAGLGATVTSQGLGGIDPKSSTGGAGGTSVITGSGGSKPCDSKTIKEAELPAQIRTTVEEFTKHVKAQKGVREEIARMSVKPLYRVEEDVKNLKQQLLVVSNSLHRYTSSINKIKLESTHELRHAEIAQRTRDTPATLQYENTAPVEYFDRLVDEFETAMTTYRSQIAETEAHFSSVSRGGAVPLTPQELMALFSKLNEGFMGLAARLHVVHEAVRAQKEAFINNRRSIHGDYQAADIFDRRRKCQATPYRPQPTTVGLTPFSSTKNSAAIAMVSGLGRTLTSTVPCTPAAGGSLTASGGSMFGGGLTDQATPAFSSNWANQKTGFGGFGSPLSTASNQKLGFGSARPLG